MARISVYRTYNFIDKDPIIDKVRTVLQDEGLLKKRNIVSRLSGVSVGTMDKWFDGDTRKPQHATLAAVATAVGYEIGFKKIQRIDVDEELKVAADWRKRQLAKLNGGAKKTAKKKKK
jgi:hypothetical protein